MVSGNERPSPAVRLAKGPPVSIKKILLVTGVVIVTLIGLIVLILPNPFGIPIIVSGLAMLIAGSDRFANWKKLIHSLIQRFRQGRARNA